MSQNYSDTIFSESHEADDDLTKIENNFIVLKSGFSGDTFEDKSSNQYDIEPFMRWSDTHNKVPRIVNPDYGQDSFFDSGTEEPFLGLMFGDKKQKIWVYRDDTIDGWVIDDTVEDIICGVVGDSVDTYNTGGNIQGTWDLGYAAHSHCILTASVSTKSEKTFDSNGDEQDIPYVAANESAALGIPVISDGYEPQHSREFSRDLYTDMSSSNQTSDWRPAAAVGTLQYIKPVDYE